MAIDGAREVGIKRIREVSNFDTLKTELHSSAAEACVLGYAPGNVLSLYFCEILLPKVAEAVSESIRFLKVNIDSVGRDVLRFLSTTRATVPICFYYKGTSSSKSSELLSALKEITFEDGSALEIHEIPSQLAEGGGEVGDGDQEDLAGLVKREPVMLFMKGSRQQPFCKFSRATLDMFRELKITRFGTFDILSNEDIRQQLKEFSKWPTYPQLYVNGEFIGGVDIIKEMVEDGSLKETLPKECFADFAHS